jgi:hypothetical protein
LGLKATASVAVGRVVQHGEGGLDLRRRQRAHALGRHGVDRDPGCAQAAVEQDSHQRAAEGMSDQDRRVLELGDDALQVLDRFRDGDLLDWRGSSRSASTSTSKPG